MVLVIGMASIFAGILYTAGPYPLAYIGLGGLFVMIFFGFVAVCGTVFVTSGMLPMLAWFGAASAGALTVNILVVNNIRDIDTDRLAGRKNIAIVFGRDTAAWEYALMLVIAFAIPPILVCKGLASPWVLLTYLSFSGFEVVGHPARGAFWASFESGVGEDRSTVIVLLLALSGGIIP